MTLKNFFMLTADSHELEKDFVKKKMKNYEKVITLETKHKSQT